MWFLCYKPKHKEKIIIKNWLSSKLTWYYSENKTMLMVWPDKQNHIEGVTWQKRQYWRWDRTNKTMLKVLPDKQDHMEGLTWQTNPCWRCDLTNKTMWPDGLTHAPRICVSEALRVEVSYRGASTSKNIKPTIFFPFSSFQLEFSNLSQKYSKQTY